MKRTKYLRSFMEEAWLCFGAALMCLAQCILNLCRAQSNLKTIQELWSKTHCLVAVSITGYGSCNRIMTQNTQLKTRKNGKEQNIELF